MAECLPMDRSNTNIKIHLLRVRSGVFGGELRTSLCGRLNKASVDGMNITDKPHEVTCAFCRKRM